MATNENYPNRFAALDGLRGLAAMVVVFSHTLAPFDHSLGLLMETTAFKPLYWLYDGRLSVFIFWVLSGFVISQSADRSRRPLTVLLLARWARLGIPIAAALLFSAALGLAFYRTGFSVPSILQTYYDPANFTLQTLLRQISWGVFAGRERISLDPVLWTMHAEIIGSCAIYILYRLISPPLRIYAFPLMTVVLLLLGRPYYMCFSTGAFFRELWKLRRVHARWPAGVLLLGLSVTLFISPGHPLLADMINWAAASAILYAVLASQKFQAILSARPCQVLGRISFPLYLVHFPIMATIGASVDTALGGGHAAGAITFFVIVGLSLIIAYLGTIAVDEPALRLLHRFRGISRQDRLRRTDD